MYSPSVKSGCSTASEHMKRQELLARELQVAIETQNIVHAQLDECVLREGVNHYVNCQELRLKYNALVNDRLHGMKLPEDMKDLSRTKYGMVSKPRELNF